MALTPVVLEERDPRGGKIFTDDLPSVVDPSRVSVIDGTILDENVWKDGAWIELPEPITDYAGREIDRLRVPGIRPLDDDGSWTIHPVMFTANQVARVVRQVERRATPKYAIQTIAIAYQRQVIASLTGKEGLVRKTVIGARIKRSGRAVLVPNADHGPEWVGIPGRFFDDGGLKHGDPVLIGRDPTIWDGSTEILLARKSGGNVVELHPLVFPQLGADCDGDTIYWFPIPDDILCQEEALGELAGFLQAHAAFQKQMLLKDESTEVTWETAKEETKERLEPTGFSVSPHDVLIMGEERVWDMIDRTSGKQGLHVDCGIMACGLPGGEWIEKVLEKNFEMLTMKKLMGPIGAACNRLKVLGGWNPSWLKSANYLSERLQQLLLDSKHGGGYDPFHALNVLNRVGKWSAATPEDALAELKEIGIDPYKAADMVLVIYRIFPMRVAIEEILPANRNLDRYIRVLRTGCSIPWEALRKRIARQFKEDGLEPSAVRRFRELVLERPLGLADIAMIYCPLHELIASDRHSQALVKRVLHQGDVDTFGVCKQAWALHQERLARRKEKRS